MPIASDDKLAIAEKVIASMADILAAAGFDGVEIVGFLRQAADHLDGGQGSAAGAPVPAQDIHSRYRAIAPVRALSQMLTGAGVTGFADEAAPEIGACFDLSMHLIPHIADAQNWLRDTARDAGLTLAHDPPPGGPSSHGGSQALILADFEFAYAPAFALIQNVAETLAAQGDEEAFRLLIMSLVEHDIIISHGLKDAVERAGQTLAAAASFTVSGAGQDGAPARRGG